MVYTSVNMMYYKRWREERHLQGDSPSSLEGQRVAHDMPVARLRHMQHTEVFKGYPTNGLLQ